MLLGEQLGRRHQGGLEVVLDGQQHREQGHHGLAGAHVAHQEAVHPVGGGHVGRDLAERAVLVVRELPGQRLPEPGGQVAADHECHAAPAPLGHGPGADQHELKVEQLVECQAAPAQLGFGRGARPVDHAQRVGKGREIERAPEGIRKHVIGERDQGIQMPVDQ